MTRNKDVLFSSAKTKTGRDTWQTPESLLSYVRSFGDIILDPCTTPQNPTGAKLFFYQGGGCDGLAVSWVVEVAFNRGASPFPVVFVNPPYSKTRDWIRKCQSEPARALNFHTITLIAARTDTRAWHEAKPDALCFIKGRVAFVDPDNPKSGKATAPFPSALLYWGPDPQRFTEVFSPIGQTFTKKERTE